VRLPDGQLIKREIEDHGNAVAVLAFDPERKMAALVRQFRLRRSFRWGKNIRLKRLRASSRMWTPSRPRGARRWRRRASVCNLSNVSRPSGPCRAFQPERMTLFLRLMCKPIGLRRWRHCGGARKYYGSGDGASKLAEMMDAGEVVDMKTLALVQALKIRHPELFL